MLTVGAILQYGKYRIEDVIAAKGSGITYRAACADREQTVVIRAAAAELIENDRGIGHFLAKARRLSQLQHPHLVQVSDCFFENNVLFLVTDFIRGQSLSHRLAKGVLPVSEALQYIRQIGQAIAFMHQKGLLHQDIQPSRILLSEANSCAAIDLNLPQMLLPKQAQNPISKNAGFVAPEVLTAAQPWTAAADVYGLAATLYTLVVGKAPRPAPGDSQRIPPVSAQLNFPLALEPAITRGMAEISQRSAQILEWLALLPDPSFSELDPLEVTNGHSNPTSVDPTSVSGLGDSIAPLTGTSLLPDQYLNVSDVLEVSQDLNPQNPTTMTQTPPITRKSTTRPSSKQSSVARPLSNQAKRQAKLRKALLWSAIVSGLGGAGLGLFLKTRYVLTGDLPNRPSALMPAQQQIDETFPPKGTAAVSSPQTPATQLSPSTSVDDPSVQPDDTSTPVANPVPQSNSLSEIAPVPSNLPEPQTTSVSPEALNPSMQMPDQTIRTDNWSPPSSASVPLSPEALPEASPRIEPFSSAAPSAYAPSSERSSPYP